MKKCLLMILFCLLPFIGLANENQTTLKKGGFKLEVSNHRVNFVSQEAILTEVLFEFSKQTGIEIELMDKRQAQTITAKYTNIPEADFLKKIIRENYVLVFNNNELEKTGLAGKSKSSQNTPDSPPPFSGTVQVEDGRAKIFYAPTDFSKDGVQNYIRERHELLAKLAKENPEMALESQISFDDFKSVAEIKDFFRENPDLKPVSLSPGWKDHSGGYDIEDKNLDEALADLKKKEGDFINLAFSRAEEEYFKSQEAPTIERAEVEENYDMWLERLNSFKEKGVMIYGVKIEGQARNMEAVRNNTQAIRLVDPIFGGETLAGINENYQASNISIPISPYVNQNEGGEK